MSEEKDEATLAMEQASGAHRDQGQPALVPQLDPSPGMPERLAVERRRARVLNMLHTLPPSAQEAIMASLGPAGHDPGRPAGPRPGYGTGGPPAAAGPHGELPGTEPVRPGRWRHFLDDPPGAAPQDEPDEEQADDPGRWPPHWPGGRQRS